MVNCLLKSWLVNFLNVGFYSGMGIRVAFSGKPWCPGSKEIKDFNSILTEASMVGMHIYMSSTYYRMAPSLGVFPSPRA